jgi:hypothetical protein
MQIHRCLIGKARSGETDGNGAEDEPCAWFRVFNGNPGCAISDPGELDDGE